MIITIVAKAENDVIGNNNQLIWHLPNDLKRFKKLTTGHPIIMGRKTYESIGKPLPNRVNIVISRSLEAKKNEKLIVVDSLQSAIEVAKSFHETIYIIGGGKVYEEAIFLSDKLEVTEVHSEFEGDTFFPEINPVFWEEMHREMHTKNEKHNYDYSFVTHLRKPNLAEPTK